MIRIHRIGLVLLTLLVLQLLSLISPAPVAAAFGDIDLFPLPNTGSEPFQLRPGSDGNVWFTEDAGNRIGHISPSGQITEFEVPTPDSRPVGLARSDHNRGMWFTEYAGNNIGHVTLGGQISEFEIPTPNSGPLGIAVGSDGNAWFAEQLGNKLGRITPAGQITEFELPAGATPTYLTRGPDGNMWVILTGSAEVARVTPSGEMTMFPVPAGGAQITKGPDGNLWLTVNSAGPTIVRLTTSGEVTGTFPVPVAGFVRVTGITTGSDGNIWFNSVGFGSSGPQGATHRMSLDGVVLSTFPLAGFLAGVSAGPDGNMWVAQLAANQLARIEVLGGDVFVVVNETVVSDGARGQVTGTIVCNAGEVFSVQLGLTQGDAMAQGGSRSRCTGTPQRFTIGFNNIANGHGFTDGHAEACVTGNAGSVGSRAINTSYEVCEPVIMDVVART